MKSILPEKPKVEQHYDDGDNGVNTGERIMHDKCEQALKQAVDEACDEEKLEAIVGDIIKSWVMNKNDETIDKISEETAKALSQHIRGCFYKESDKRWNLKM